MRRNNHVLYDVTVDWCSKYIKSSCAQSFCKIFLHISQQVVIHLSVVFQPYWNIIPVSDYPTVLICWPHMFLWWSPKKCNIIPGPRKKPNPSKFYTFRYVNMHTCITSLSHPSPLPCSRVRSYKQEAQRRNHINTHHKYTIQYNKF